MHLPPPFNPCEVVPLLTFADTDKALISCIAKSRGYTDVYR